MSTPFRDVTLANRRGDNILSPTFEPGETIDRDTLAYLEARGPDWWLGGSRLWIRLGDGPCFFLDIGRHQAEWEEFIDAVDAEIGGWIADGIEHLRELQAERKASVELLSQSWE